MKPFILELTEHDPLRVFAALQHLPYSLLFDSADRKHINARYSFVVSHPIETIESKNGHITITNWDEQKRFEGNPFTILQNRLNRWIDNTETVRGLPPFQGGAAGLFGYDLGRDIEILPEKSTDNAKMPDMAVGIYDQVITFDHLKKQTWLITHARNYDEARKKQSYLLSLIQHGPDIPVYQGSALDWQSNLESSDYKKRVRNIIEHIGNGDIFQANMAQRFDAMLPEDFDPFAHYTHLRDVNPAPFSGYMNLGDIKISATSPERFLHVKDGHVETRPIKGTRPHGADPAADEACKKELEGSAKDRAENTMIVDLLRNDLSKVCTAESLRVPELCKLESFASVHHLVSTVRGELKEGKTAIDLLQACFPGGSITGAPKIRAMEIIETLEPTRRGPYCGAMGYIGFDGAMDSNILIRTLVFEPGTVSLQTGGGITIESDPSAEYQETLDKAAAIFRSFEARLPEMHAQQEEITASAKIIPLRAQAATRHT